MKHLQQIDIQQMNHTLVEAILNFLVQKKLQVLQFLDAAHPHNAWNFQEHEKKITFFSKLFQNRYVLVILDKSEAIRHRCKCSVTFVRFHVVLISRINLTNC